MHRKIQQREMSRLAQQMNKYARSEEEEEEEENIWIKF